MPPVSRLGVANRIAAGVLGSWLFVWGLISGGIVALSQLGMGYSDAQALMNIVGLLALLSAFVWAFAAARVGRVWITLGGGGAVMGVAAWWLARAAA